MVSGAWFITSLEKESGEAGTAHGDDSVDPLPTTSPESSMEGREQRIAVSATK